MEGYWHTQAPLDVPTRDKHTLSGWLNSDFVYTLNATDFV